MVHLHTHSFFSFGLGASAPEDLADAAARRGFSALALTDTNGVYGAIPFQRACQAVGIRPILGAHLVTRDHSAVALAENEQGWAALCRAITTIHWDPTTSLPELLAHDRSGLAILAANSDFLERIVRSSGPANLYAELRPEAARHAVLATARRLKIPAVVSGAVIAANVEDWPRHRLLRAIHDNTTLSRVTGLRPRNAWLRSAEDIAQHFPDVPEALTAATALAERCQYTIPMGRTIAPRAARSGDTLQRLRALAEAGARQRYGTITPQIAERLTHELDIIAVKDFADYFLVVHEIVEEFPVHCGRGSVANSLVSYCLKITHVEPLASDLLFERFLNPARTDPPDIDLDFPWDERDRVLAWVFRKYPRPQAAMVSNHNTLQVAGALREVAKVYGRPAAEIRDITRRIPYFARGPIAEIIHTHPNFQACHLPTIWEEIAAWAETLINTPRHLSLHPGGVVIVPGSLTDYVPIERAAKQLDGAPDLPVPVIQFEKDGTEDAGLVKIDLLGNRSLAVIRDARDMVAVNTGRRIDLTSQDAGNDPATRRLFRTGRTLGVFYTESPASRIVNEKSSAEEFETLVLNTSIIRPASNKWIKIYLDRFRGGVPYDPVHPSVDVVLKRSYGIMVYQEDVVNVAHAFAGFSWAEADGLRKALSKKRPEKILAGYRAEFVSRARAMDRAMSAIDQLWEMILSFSGYSFCKGHSCSYIQVAQQSCYLRANYPAEFFAGVLANEGGFYRPFAYVAEAQREGLVIRSPDVNASAWRWTGAGQALRVGFQFIKGLTRASAERLLEARAKDGPYHSLAGVRDRALMRDDELRSLIKVGALDSIASGRNRPQLLWQLDSTRPAREQHGRLTLPPDQRSVPPLVDYSVERKRRDAWDLLGFCLDAHPMTLYRDRLATFRLTHSSDLHQQVGRRVLMAGMYITGKPVHTSQNEPMQFATFDDGTGLVECVLFPEVYRRYGHLLFDQGPFLFRGIVEEEFGVRTVTVSQVERLDRVLARRGQSAEMAASAAATPTRGPVDA